MVQLNYDDVVAVTDGPLQALKSADELDRSCLLQDYHALHASRADLLRRPGRSADADAASRQAVQLASSGAQRHFLARRLTEVSGE